MYAITAHLCKHVPERGAQVWKGSHQLPTFYLDETVQGITDELHAVRIAHQILDPMGILTISITAERIN